MKKLMFLISLVLIASFTLAACGPAPATQPPAATEAPIVAPATAAPATAAPATAAPVTTDDVTMAQADPTNLFPNGLGGRPHGRRLSTGSPTEVSGHDGLPVPYSDLPRSDSVMGRHGLCHSV